jgi:hypothetical protein
LIRPQNRDGGINWAEFEFRNNATTSIEFTPHSKAKHRHRSLAKLRQLKRRSKIFAGSHITEDWWSCQWRHDLQFEMHTIGLMHS